MAEILAIASGVITVAQVAGQVGGISFRLKNLWSEVKDVPESINRLMMKLEVYDSVLSAMDQQLACTQTLMQMDRPTILSLEYCRKAKRDLDELVNDIQFQISSVRKFKRGVAKFKVTLKKNLIRTYEERLRDALELLSISQEVHRR